MSLLSGLPVLEVCYSEISSRGSAEWQEMMVREVACISGAAPWYGFQGRNLRTRGKRVALVGVSQGDVARFIRLQLSGQDVKTSLYLTLAP